MTQPIQSPDVKAEWLAELDALMTDAEAWATAEGWATHREFKRITESKLGDYTAPSLSVRSPSGGTVYLDPVARHVTAADGLVDLCAWPTLRRLYLVRQGRRWVLKTDSGIPWPQAWSPETFREVVPMLGVTSEPALA